MKMLGEFIVEKQHDFPHATGELTALISAIKLGTKIVHRDINKAGLVDILGASGVENVQGEQQMKLDLFANEKLKAALKARGIVAGIASEEEDEFVIFEGEENGKYVVLMDPLDGSSNIDVNVSFGAIFSIYSIAASVSRVRQWSRLTLCRRATSRSLPVMWSTAHQP